MRLSGHFAVLAMVEAPTLRRSTLLPLSLHRDETPADVCPAKHVFALAAMNIFEGNAFILGSQIRCARAVSASILH